MHKDPDGEEDATSAFTKNRRAEQSARSPSLQPGKIHPPSLTIQICHFCHLGNSLLLPGAILEPLVSLLIKPCNLVCSYLFLRTGERGEGGTGVMRRIESEAGGGVRGTRKLAGPPSLKSRPDDTLVFVLRAGEGSPTDLRPVKEGSSTIPASGDGGSATKNVEGERESRFERGGAALVESW